MILETKIVEMNESHLDDLALLEKQCFSVPWSRSALEAELEKENSRFFVAITKNEVSGYIGANNILGEVYVNNIAVFYNYRELGIGSKLLSHLIDVAKEEILKGIGFNPRGNESNVYSIEEEGTCLVATAEITLGGFHSGEILDKSNNSFMRLTSFCYI